MFKRPAQHAEEEQAKQAADGPLGEAEMFTSDSTPLVNNLQLMKTIAKLA